VFSAAGAGAAFGYVVAFDEFFGGSVEANACGETNAGADVTAAIFLAASRKGRRLCGCKRASWGVRANSLAATGTAAADSNSAGVNDEE